MRPAYGKVGHETVVLEQGERVACAYDEVHAIQRRLVDATGELLVLMQQIWWQS